jgi:hypothetical protein
MSLYAGLNGDAAFPGLGVTGGQVQGVRVLVNDGVADGVMLAIDASGLPMAATEPSVSSANEAALQMSTSRQRRC